MLTDEQIKNLNKTISKIREELNSFKSKVNNLVNIIKKAEDVLDIMEKEK